MAGIAAAKQARGHQSPVATQGLARLSGVNLNHLCARFLTLSLVHSLFHTYFAGDGRGTRECSGSFRKLCLPLSFTGAQQSQCDRSNSLRRTDTAAVPARSASKRCCSCSDGGSFKEQGALQAWVHECNHHCDQQGSDGSCRTLSCAAIWSVSHHLCKWPADTCCASRGGAWDGATGSGVGPRSRTSVVPNLRSTFLLAISAWMRKLPFQGQDSPALPFQSTCPGSRDSSQSHRLSQISITAHRQALCPCNKCTLLSACSSTLSPALLLSLSTGCSQPLAKASSGLVCLWVSSFPLTQRHQPLVEASSGLRLMWY
jgi:hypothetical protein